MDGALSKYPNAFSIMLPGISGAGYLHRLKPDASSAVNGIRDSGISLDGTSYSYPLCDQCLTPRSEMCVSIGDALLKLAAGDRCSHYLPGIVWNLTARGVGLPSSCRHLITQNQATDSSGETSEEVKKDDNHVILQKILECLDVSETDFSPELPFTSFGLDSLGATKISQILRPYVTISQMQLLGGITWPETLERMERLKPSQDPEEPSLVDMLDMVTKYTQDFEVHSGSTPVPTEDVVIITGSTGSIGTYALAELLTSPKVVRVYAFNRKAPSRSLFERQKEALSLRGLDPSLASSPKLVLLEIDLAQADFGLEDIGILQEVRLIPSKDLTIFNLLLDSVLDDPHNPCR